MDDLKTALDYLEIAEQATNANAIDSTLRFAAVYVAVAQAEAIIRIADALEAMVSEREAKGENHGR